MTQMAKPLLDVLAGQRGDRPPVWLMRQAGRYLPEYRELRGRAGTFLDLCYDPDFAVEATLQPIRRYDLDAAIIFSDILVIPHALGRALSFEEGHGPVLEPLTSPAEVEALASEGVADRLDAVYRALAKVREVLPETVTLIGFAGAPWTIASYMIEGGTSRDHLAIRRFAYEAPAVFDALIETLTRAVTEHLVEQIRAGAEAVQIFDTWAGILPPAGLRRYSLEPIRRIAEGVRAAAPEIPVIAFPRGVGAAYAEFAAIEAIAAISIDTGVDPVWAARAIQPGAAVQGNLDPAALIAGGTAMEQGIAGICAALEDGPHVFNLGHGVMPMTPPDHVARLIEIVKGLAK